MATLSYITTTEEDEIIVWELARRARASKTPLKDAQVLLTLEVGFILRTWQADRKMAVITKLQADPSSLTADDKAILGIK